MVSVCLPSDALLQHLLSYLGFSYLGCGVSLYGCSSKAQPLLLTLDEGYLLTAALPDLQYGIAPLGPPGPAQPRILCFKSSRFFKNILSVRLLRFLLFSRSVVSHSLQPHGLQHASLPCPSPFPRACPNSFPLSQWYHSTISFSVAPFSSCLPSFPGSFPVSHLFTTCGQSIGVSASASVLPMNIQDWFPLGLIGLASL